MELPSKIPADFSQVVKTGFVPVARSRNLNPSRLVIITPLYEVSGFHQETRERW